MFRGVGGGFFDGVCVFWGVHVGPAVFGVSEDEVGCDGVFLEDPGEKEAIICPLLL